MDKEGGAVMVAYFARRIVGGVMTLFLAGLVLYSLVLYIPGGVLQPTPMPHEVCCTAPRPAQVALSLSLIHI